jgi:SAM-dependent methyltransferase
METELAKKLYLNSTRTTYYINTPTKATRKIIKEFPPMKILDYGAGTGRNAFFLAKNGFKVKAYDPFPKNKKYYFPIISDDKILKEEYDLILCTFVLNVLPPEYREMAINTIRSIKSKYVIIEVRSEKAIQDAMKKTWLAFQGGYATGGKKATFQKGFKIEELLKMKLGLGSKKWVDDRSAVSVIYF